MTKVRPLHAGLLVAAALAAFAPPRPAGARGFDSEGAWASRGAIAPDLDGDGAPDLIMAQSFLDYGPQRGRLKVFLGDPSAPGRWRVRTDAAVGGNPLDLVAADLDGNGLLDVATANAADGTVSVLLHAPAGVFTRADYPASRGAVGVAAGDLNRDGLADIAVAGGDDAAILFQDGSAPGTFLAPVVLASGFSPSCVAVADMDGAGGQDLVIGTFDRIGVLLQDPGVAGSFPFVVPLGIPGHNVRRIVVSDLDGNGYTDIACAMKGEPYLGPGKGLGILLQAAGGGLSFTTAEVDEGQPLKSVELADMDGDGTPDLLCSGGGLVLWYRQDPLVRGSFERGGKRDVNASEGGIAAADFDGDGLTDAGIGFFRTYLLLQKPNGKGKFLSPKIYRETGR